MITNELLFIYSILTVSVELRELKSCESNVAT